MFSRGEKKMARIKATCGTCKFYVTDKCYFHPKEIKKDSSNFCGQWLANPRSFNTGQGDMPIHFWDKKGFFEKPVAKQEKVNV
jgi:hypothetical protein